MRIFKTGDKVYDAHYGWGVVSRIDESEDVFYAVSVSYVNKTKKYSRKGQYGINGERVLSFTAYTPEVNQDRNFAK